MSSDHEASYYEIALTNRQVLTIFIVLLTCLVAAFLSGVWIGRRDGVEATLQASVGERVAESATESATAPMTELNFFSDDPAEESRGETAKAPPVRPPAAAADKPIPPATKAAEPPSPKTAAAEPPVTTSPPQPAGAPSGQPPAAAAEGSRVIQVFSTLDAAQADKLVRRLGEGGYPAFLVEENLQGRTTYRVRVGPYRQQVRAQKIADELRREYRLETWITSQSG